MERALATACQRQTDRDARGRGSLFKRLQGQKEVIKKKVPRNGTRGLCPSGLNPVQTARPQQEGGRGREEERVACCMGKARS